LSGGPFRRCTRGHLYPFPPKISLVPNRSPPPQLVHPLANMRSIFPPSSLTFDFLPFPFLYVPSSLCESFVLRKKILLLSSPLSEVMSRCDAPFPICLFLQEIAAAGRPILMWPIGILWLNSVIAFSPYSALSIDFSLVFDMPDSSPQQPTLIRASL